MIGRIRSSRTFERLRQDGRVVRRGAVEIVYLCDGGGGVARLGFAVSRRTGPAVARNRLRRRLRAVMHELASAGHILPSGDYVLRPRRGAVEASYGQLKSDLRRAIENVCTSEVPR